jgi:hypothetical protein
VDRHRFGAGPDPDPIAFFADQDTIWILPQVLHKLEEIPLLRKRVASTAGQWRPTFFSFATGLCETKLSCFGGNEVFSPSKHFLMNTKVQVYF